MTGFMRWMVRVSEPWLAIFLTTNILAPLERVTTAMTEATPMTTPSMVRMVRILFAQSDCSATRIASVNCISGVFPCSRAAVLKRTTDIFRGFWDYFTQFSR